MSRYTFWLIVLLTATAACSSANETKSSDVARVTPPVTGEIRSFQPEPCTAGVTGQGCVYGIFVGMAQNTRPDIDLPYADEDARRLAQALRDGHIMRSRDGVVLVNENATERSLELAFRRLGSRMRPQDSFIFFFDGHGDRGRVKLWGGAMEKTRLSLLLRSVPAQQILLIFDMCHAAAFADLTRGEASRQVVGWFSSRANESSYVPVEGRTGGFLADLFIQSIGDVRTSNRWVYARDITLFVDARYPLSDESRSQHLVVAGRNMALWRAPSGSRAAARQP